MTEKQRAKNNRTTFVTSDEIGILSKRLLKPDAISESNFLDKTIVGDIEEASKKLPEKSVAHNNLQPYITCYMYKRTA